MGHGIGNLSEKTVAEVLLTLLCLLFLTEHCECLSVSYLHVPSIPRHVPAPRHGKSEQQMCFLPSCDAVGISDLGGQWVDTWGQVPPCHCKVQNGALRPPFPLAPLRVQAHHWSQNVFSAPAPCLSPQPGPYTCLAIICLFRPRRIGFWCQS